MRLHTRLNAVPGGFRFIDAPISHEPMIEWGFTYLVDQVIARRRANPRFNLSLDPIVVGNEIEEQNALRVSKIPQSEIYLVEGSVGSPQAGFPVAHRNAPQSVAAKSRNIVAGIGVLTDWLGSGAEPVTHQKAEERASKCVSCPGNDKGDWTRFFTQPAADLIRKQVEVARDMSLSTRFDKQLNVCSVCLCPLKTKVFVPIEHIKAHTTPEVLEKLKATNSDCWLVSEINS
jgi:hypothetical protein